MDLNANAQNQGEMEKIQACLDELEELSRKAHESVRFAYAPLLELYALKAG